MPHAPRHLRLHGSSLRDLLLARHISYMTVQERNKWSQRDERKFCYIIARRTDGVQIASLHVYLPKLPSTLFKHVRALSGGPSEVFPACHTSTFVAEFNPPPRLHVLWTRHLNVSISSSNAWILFVAVVVAAGRTALILKLQPTACGPDAHRPSNTLTHRELIIITWPINI